MGQHQREGLVQALRQHLDAEFGAQLLAHLGDGVRASASPAVWSLAGSGDCGGGLVAEASRQSSVVSGSRVAGGCGTVVIIISPLWRVVEGRAAVLFRGWSLHALA